MTASTAAVNKASGGPASAPAAPAFGQMTHRQILTIFVGLMLGMFLAALDQTIVTTAIRTIGDDLHGLSLQAWVTTAYLITATISTPLYGKLSDIYGRKPFFLLAISLFIIGSAACSFATSMYMLAAFRAFQGLGAGGLFSLALAIIADIVSPRERARYQGYFLAVFGTSSVIGPLVGGAFSGQPHLLFISGWRWVFLVNVPIGIIALFVVWHTLNIPHTRREHRIDWKGSLALIIGLVRGRRGRSVAVRTGREADPRGRADSVTVLPQSHVQPHRGFPDHFRCRHVRCDPVAAVVSADREGRVADQVRSADAAADRRHHVGLGRLRSADFPDRSLQGVPGGRWVAVGRQPRRNAFHQCRHRILDHRGLYGGIRSRPR
jgi:hypothetical protein